MRAVSAQDRFVPVLIAAHEAVFEHAHGGAPDPQCLGCVAAAEGALMSAFGAWEAFLFDLAVELMAGAQTQDWYRHYCRTKTHFPSLAAARAQLLCTRLTGNTVNILAAPRNYLLLHHPSAVIQIVNYWL